MRIFWRKIILLFVFPLFLFCFASAQSLPASHPRPVHFPKISQKNLLKIYREAERSVVEIDTDAAQGSGVVVGKEGVIVTNYHVIQGARTAVVRTMEGQTIPVQGILEVDKSHDLVILKTKPSKALVPIKLGDSSHVTIGEKIIAVGNPEGYQDTISEGIVSGFRLRFGQIYWGFKLFQITAPISPGSSGGALLNQKGELIGITSAGYVSEAQNLNVAIPINYVKPMIPSRHFYLIEKFTGKKKVSTEQKFSPQFLKAYFYMTGNFLNVMTELVHAEEASFSRQKLDPKFYEVKAELNELAALSNSGFSSDRSPFEQHLQFTSSNLLIELSESTEDFIHAFHSKKGFFQTLGQGKEMLKKARNLLLENAEDVLNAGISYQDKNYFLKILENHPVYFKGDLYYGMILSRVGSGKEEVVFVYPDSPASHAGIQEGDFLTSQLNSSLSAAYKKQVIILKDGESDKTLTITPVRFGYDEKPETLGIMQMEGKSSPGKASQEIKSLLLSFLGQQGNLFAVSIPSSSSSISNIAQKYGLGYLLVWKLEKFEADAVYGLSPSRFEGYKIRIRASFTVYDPYGQQTSCCQPQEITIQVPFFQTRLSSYKWAFKKLVEQVIQQMKTAGIVKPYSAG